MECCNGNYCVTALFTSVLIQDIVTRSFQCFFHRGMSLSLGCSVSVEGQLVPSRHPQQSVELAPSEIHLIGDCNPQVSLSCCP